jgi:hypothetical protein
MILFQSLASCTKEEKNITNAVRLPITSIPLAGNAYVTSPVCSDASGTYTSDVLTNWSNTNTVISTYFYLSQGGTLALSIDAAVPVGQSEINVSLNGVTKKVTLAGATLKTYDVGLFAIDSSGYVNVDIQGISKTGSVFAIVPDIKVSGTATVSSTTSVSNVVFANDSTNYYWSLRGPSVHLAFPDRDSIEWFYSEITVPIGEDQVGSYFMANGFGEGYFGIQVNSQIERRILFSVWNPTTGTTIANRVGTNVVAQTFSGEGTGGQAYLDYNWRAGVTYKFLTQAHPETNNSTIYSAWIYIPEENQWVFIATWNRPNTSTYLKSLYSFIENFNPDFGYFGRKAFFGNQWGRKSNGTWQEFTNANFTTDPTGMNHQRLDFTGGVNGTTFYLQMDGFFSNNNLVNNASLTRNSNSVAPVVDLTALP